MVAGEAARNRIHAVGVVLLQRQEDALVTPAELRAIIHRVAGVQSYQTIRDYVRTMATLGYVRIPDNWTPGMGVRIGLGPRLPNGSRSTGSRTAAAAANTDPDARGAPAGAESV